MTSRKAPAGMFRVIGVDLFEHTDYLVGDFCDKITAFRVADEHNLARIDSMDDIYYVYDDKGNYIHGNEAVEQKIAP